MRIGFVSTGHIQQNASTMRCLKLANYLLKDGHEVYLFISGNKENISRYGEIYNGIRMRYSLVGRTPLEQITKTAILDHVKLDYIHCISSGSSVHFPGWLAKQHQRGRPCLIMDFDEWHSLWIRYPKCYYQLAWEWFACKYSDRVIFASRYLLDHLGRFAQPDRRFYLPYAVDWDQFVVDKVGWKQIRDRYPQRKLAVYLGTLLQQYRSNIEKVLEVVQTVHAIEPTVLFLFIGTGELKESLEQQVQEAGLSPWVQFLGYMSDRQMTQYLCAADVLLFPIEDTELNRSRCPSKVFLYLASQRPIVTNPVGEVLNILGEHAVYFDFHSSKDFTEKIVGVLNNEAKPVFTESMIAQHTWSVRYEKYLQILTDTVIG